MRTSSDSAELAVAGSPSLLLLLGLLLAGCAPGPEGPILPVAVGEEALAISSGFGPRLKASEGYRYDFHRGIDLPVPEGTPVVAIADGTVRIAGEHPAYADPVVQIAHGDACTARPEGCTYSGYLHLSGWAVAPGDRVVAGQVIGWTGTSESGFPHLHFEIREGGVWQRHAVNPIPVLGLADEGAPEIGVDVIGTTVAVTVAVGPRELDLASVRVEVIDADGKVVRGQTWDPEAWNRAWTHPAPEWPAPWCPFHDAHPPGTAYDPHVHLDDPQFNGVFVEPAAFRATSAAWSVTLSFDGILGHLDPDEHSVRVLAEDLGGRVATRRAPAAAHSVRTPFPIGAVTAYTPPSLP